MMPSREDLLLQTLSELTEAVRANGENNRERMLADLRAVIAESDTLARNNDQPVRRGAEGPEIAEGGATPSLPRSNRYRNMSAEDIYLAHMIVKRMHQINLSGESRPPSQELEAARMALDTSTAGAGAELMPSLLGSSLWEDIRVEARIAQEMIGVDMPSDPFTVPLGLGDVTYRKGTQNNSSTPSDPATADSVLTSTELVAEVDWSYDADEDSIVAMLPALRNLLAVNGAESIDAFLLNADSTNAATGNINLDDADPADDSYYLSAGQDGLRHLWLVDNTGQGVSAGAAVSDTLMNTMLGKLGKYGLDPRTCRIVPGVETYLTMLGLTNVTTVDKFGPQATILTGQLGAYRGIPIIPSAAHALTEADGKVSTTAGNNTKGAMTAYNRNGWYIGFRRALMIEVDRLIQKRQYVLVASFRLAVAAYGTRASAKHAAGMYNITV